MHKSGENQSSDSRRKGRLPQKKWTSRRRIWLNRRAFAIRQSRESCIRLRLRCRSSVRTRWDATYCSIFISRRKKKTSSLFRQRSSRLLLNHRKLCLNKLNQEGQSPDALHCTSHRLVEVESRILWLRRKDAKSLINHLLQCKAGSIKAWRFRTLPRRSRLRKQLRRREWPFSGTKTTSLMKKRWCRVGFTIQ